jgi:hypothetical protein
MKKSEAEVQAEIRLNLPANVTMFRNNVGSMIDPYGRKVDFGLCKGSSDLIGWTELEITPDMVGQKVAVFTAIEVKREGWKPSGKREMEHYQQQQNFIFSVNKSGGLAGFADKLSDIEIILNRWQGFQK